MTSALLHRSRAFVRLGGVGVDILTFNVGANYEAVERDLRTRGELVDGVGLLNLWDWLVAWDMPEDAPGRLTLDEHQFSPLPATGERLVTRRTADGTLLQADHYRPDGTLAVSELRDGRVRGELGGRSIVLCDRRGHPARSWGRAWALYRYWLDRLAAGGPSWFIVDSKTSANFMLTYRRRSAVVVHLVHNSHEGRTPSGIRASRQRVFENLKRFDSVVLLTQRQHRDVLALPHGRLAVIPNSRQLPPFDGVQGQRAGGVVLASLTARKRVDHAIEAVRREQVELDIYGAGELRGVLGRLIADAGLAQRVRLRGYVPGASAVLVAASFVLLTAESEGFPLVLVEAMAAGCIPIAYDVKYGPADMIRNRKNGFLVPTGDVEALRTALHEFLALPPSAVTRMRRAAVQTASGYSDAAVTRLWNRELRAARRRKVMR
jgi:poly(glycerol-phosphate) alpha-glucosyltransferase